MPNHGATDRGMPPGLLFLVLVLIAGVGGYLFFTLKRGGTESRGGFAVGQMPPDIQGQDLDGVAFKLSDYRGKVVVLDFWGDW